MYHSILPFDDHYTYGTHQIFNWTNRSPLQLTHHSSLNLVHNYAFNININWQKQILSVKVGNAMLNGYNDPMLLVIDNSDSPSIVEQ